MEKIFSTRIDESVIHRIAALSQTLGISKKAVVEDAILRYAEKVEKENNIDVFDQTSGAWKREETPDESVEKTRELFRRSMQRYQQ